MSVSQRSGASALDFTAASAYVSSSFPDDGPASQPGKSIEGGRREGGHHQETLEYNKHVGTNMKELFMDPMNG